MAICTEVYTEVHIYTQRQTVIMCLQLTFILLKLLAVDMELAERPGTSCSAVPACTVITFSTAVMDTWKDFKQKEGRYDYEMT